MKIGLVGDVHLSDKPPTHCTENYNDQIFEMLWEVVRLAAFDAWSAVVFAGDIFHHKGANRTSHRTVQRMISVIQAFPCPVYLVIGNHDITNDRLASVHETQPFGVLLQAGARLLSGWASESDGPSDLPLYGVPWQQDWQNASDAFAEWRASDGPLDGLIVTHAPLYPPGKELPWENVPAVTVADWAGNSGYLYYGHVHPRHGTFDAGGVWFCNQGAISRGSLHEEDISRHPAVTVWHDSQEGALAFERVELASAAPAEEVFRFDVAAAKERYDAKMGAFLARIGKTDIEVSSVEAVIAHVRSLDLAPGEVALAEEALVMAATGEVK